jgi:hypothetical protein
MVVCRQHTQPTTNPPLNPTTDPYIPTSYYKPNLVNMSSNSNLPSTYRQALLRDRPAHAHTADHYNPRSCLAGHPLAPFLTAPQLPPVAQDLAQQWNLNMDEDSRRLWSSPPPCQPKTWDGPLTSRPAQSTRTYSKASTPPPHSPCQVLITWCFPSRIDPVVGLATLCMLGSPPMAFRKS